MYIRCRNKIFITCCVFSLLTKTKSQTSHNYFYSARLTAKQALDHPWLIRGTVHPMYPLSTSNLKRYVIKKRWIKAVNTIIALKRMGAKIDAELI